MLSRAASAIGRPKGIFHTAANGPSRLTVTVTTLPSALGSTTCSKISCAPGNRPVFVKTRLGTRAVIENDDDGPLRGHSFPTAPTTAGPSKSTERTSESHCGHVIGSAHRANTSAGAWRETALYDDKMITQVLYALTTFLVGATSSIVRLPQEPKDSRRSSSRPAKGNNMPQVRASYR